MKKNIIYALLANVVNAGVAWLLLLFLIRAGSNEDIGIYSLAQAIALPIHLFFTLKLRTIQLSDIDSDHKNSDYFNSRLILALISFLITVLLSILLYSKNYYYILAVSILGLGYSAMIVREYFISIYQIQEKNQYFLYSNIILGLLSSLGFVFIYLLTENVIWSITVFSIFRLLCLSFDIYIAKKFFVDNVLLYIKDFNKQGIVRLVEVGLPLGITAVIGALFTSIPRIKLEEVSGLEILGVFTTLMSLIAFFNLFMSSFSQALIPRMAAIYKQSKSKLLKEIGIWFLILLLALMVGLCVTYYNSEFILATIFGEKYIQYASEFFISIVSGCVLCLFHYSNLMLNVQRSFKSQVYIYSLCALACFIASILLIPHYQLKGAIYTSIICSLIGTIASVSVFFINLSRLKNAPEN